MKVRLKMQRLLISWLCFLLAAVPAVKPAFVERYNYFNVDLLQMINEDKPGNLILSPASAKLGLMTLAEATGGRTREELLSALRLPDNAHIIRNVAGQTLAVLKKNVRGTEIDTATRLWARQGLRISHPYAQALQQYYDSDVQMSDFDNAPAAVNDINNWARQATREKIQSVVDINGIQADTQLLLTSALYFKGRWMKSFNKEKTRQRCFNVPNVGCQNTLFMEVTAKYRYAYIASLDADVIEIPYSDGKTSMLVLLPYRNSSNQGLRILIKDLSYIPLSTLLEQLHETEVYLSIPKFAIESKLDLRAPLERMGIKSLFDYAANLTGIVEENSLRVSSVIQNAKIEVDEDGTVAAAVTGFGIVPLMGEDTEMFEANKPFMFMIIDLDTNGTLFSGWVIDPTISNSNIIH